MGTARRIAILLSILLTVAGCGLLGGEEQPAAQEGQPKKVKVAVLPTMDTVPLHLAIDSGYFRQDGLDVEPVTAASGADCVAKLTSGEVDFAFSSYTPFFVAKSKNAADIKLVADATSAAPGYAVVVVAQNSPLQSIKDLAGKRVAITARFTISHLLTQAQLKAAGVDHNSVQWIEMAFPQMSGQLTSGQIDAAFLVEPFLQQAIQQIKARPLFDTLAGPTEGIALTGYGATSKFIDANGDAVRSFQQGLRRATDEVRADRAKVDPLLVKIAKVDPQIAKQTALTEFVASLDPAKIQRVVDLMVEFGALEKGFDVSQMIVRPAA
ncbi:ABC transporter substrate-binding protein [Actinophytocola sp.]|uniref:ABC transporter substrate-binding protein n=1 Tax=Actinophytocola sp. TaxID=1872138 RepID=UPI002D7F1E00|nr:MqnA/MqnD/SBP family protein [Actinophytocola sp.]HET9141225.1 MqnA/MqnD/SBP family protein [Actinophytocola sp.]